VVFWEKDADVFLISHVVFCFCQEEKKICADNFYTFAAQKNKMTK